MFTDFQKLEAGNDLKQEKSFHYVCTLKPFSTPSVNDTMTQRLISAGAHRAEEPQPELPWASKEAQIHPWGSLDWLHFERVESVWGSNLQGHSVVLDDLLTNPLQHLY